MKKLSSRLKKLAEIADLSEKNMTKEVLNEILQIEDLGATVENTIYRRMMNSNTRLVVEIWELNNQHFAVFSGYYNGPWNKDNINFNGSFDNSTAAEMYVQEHLQDQADRKENLFASKKNEVINKLAAGEEPDYQTMVSNFLKNVKIPEQDKKNETTLNRHYNEWINYMNKYYPAWAAYPAYIWRGWGYVVDKVVDPEAPKDSEDQTEDNNTQDSNPLNKPGIEVGNDSSFDSGGGGESNS